MQTGPTGGASPGVLSAVEGRTRKGAGVGALGHERRPNCPKEQHRPCHPAGLLVGLGWHGNKHGDDKEGQQELRRRPAATQGQWGERAPAHSEDDGERRVWGGLGGSSGPQWGAQCQPPLRSTLKPLMPLACCIPLGSHCPFPERMFKEHSSVSRELDSAVDLTPPRRPSPSLCLITRPLLI